MLCACFAPQVGCGRRLWVKFVKQQAILLSPHCLRKRGLAISSPSAVQVALGASALPPLWVVTGDKGFSLLPNWTWMPLDLQSPLQSGIIAINKK